VWEKFGIAEGRSYVSVPIGVEVPSELEPGEVTLHQPEGVVFGVVSRLDPEKRIQDVIEAFDRVAAEHPKSRLLIWGDGPYAKELREQAASASHGDRIELRGWIEQPYKAFEEVDCLMLVSSSEGIPRSILEAGLMGVPSIATPVGGVPGVIDDGDTGWLVNVGDIDAIADVMASLMRNPEKILEAGARARKKIETEFSLQKEMDSLRTVLG